MKGFQVDGRRGGIGTSFGPEYPGNPFEQLRLPWGDLVWMDIVLLGQFGQRLLALDRGQSHFRFKSRRVVPACVVVCSSSLLLDGHSGRVQAETPLISPSKFAKPPLHSGVDTVRPTLIPLGFLEASRLFIWLFCSRILLRHTDYPCWISGNGGTRWNILYHHRSSTDHRTIADLHVP